MWTLQKVKHVLKLKKNLITVRQLDDGNYSIVFFEWYMERKGVMVLTYGKKISTLYVKLRSSNMIAISETENNVEL